MLSQDKVGNYMKSIKVLTAVALTTLSLVAVAADKPAETKPADKSATTAPAPAPTAFDIMSPTGDIERALQDRDESPIQGPDIEEALKNRNKVK